MLALLLSPLCGAYTATDLYENMRLVSRNLELNRRLYARPAPGVQLLLEELDWVATSSSTPAPEARSNGLVQGAYDLVLAVDCIYNEYLTGPFIETLSAICPVGGSTVALVIVEMRSADVVSLLEITLD